MLFVNVNKKNENAVEDDNMTNQRIFGAGQSSASIPSLPTFLLDVAALLPSKKAGVVEDVICIFLILNSALRLKKCEYK